MHESCAKIIVINNSGGAANEARPCPSLPGGRGALHGVCPQAVHTHAPCTYTAPAVHASHTCMCTRTHSSPARICRCIRADSSLLHSPPPTPPAEYAHSPRHPHAPINTAAATGLAVSGGHVTAAAAALVAVIDPRRGLGAHGWARGS